MGFGHWTRAIKHFRSLAHDRPERQRARPADLDYAVDEVPPLAVLIGAALQQAALVASTLAYPIILAHEAGLPPGAMLDFVSISMLALGVGTVLMCVRSQWIGSGYLCPTGFTQIYLGPSLFAAKLGGLPLVFGMTMVAGFLQLSMAPLLRRMRALLPSEIAGLIIAIVGLSLAGLGVSYGLGIEGGQRIDATHVVITGISLLIMVIFNVWTGGHARMFCALIGIGVGYALSAAFGLLDFHRLLPAEGLRLVHLPDPGHMGWRFGLDMLAPFAVVAIATTLRAMGDVSNAQRLNDKDWVRPNFRSLATAVAANGLASMFCGLTGTAGLNSYSASVGLSGATGVTSRAVGYSVGIIYALLSVVPAAAVVVAAIPEPVIGASMFFSSAFVFISGLQMITARLLDARKTIVIGFSFALAIMSEVDHDAFMQVPVALQPIFGNSLVLGTVSAVLLNLIMRIGVRKRVTLHIDSGPIDREAIERFLIEQGAHWAARRDVVNRAQFGLVQSIEVLGEAPGPIEIEASFDEFTLDVRIGYVGVRLVIPERRPSPEEIIASEEGERLLAGYLLRRNADRISSRSLGERAEINLHYDH